MFLMWLGEQITSRGIGNGISLIILAGIVAELPSALFGMFELGRQGALSTGIILAVIVMSVVVIAFIVFMERAQRRLLIQYPKRQVGNQMFEGQSSHLPLKLNTSGVIPPIFASSLLLLPTTVANFNAGQGGEVMTWITTQLWRTAGRCSWCSTSALIVFFAFFYTAIVFNPTETADNLKKHGGFIPGIRPGERTAEYIDYVLSRITVVGAAYLAIVCLIPEILISYAAVPFYFGGTSLLIVVSVTMDTVSQVQGYLLAHQYEGLIKKIEAARAAADESELARRIAFTIGALLVYRHRQPIFRCRGSIQRSGISSSEASRAACSACSTPCRAGAWRDWRCLRSASSRTSRPRSSLQLVRSSRPRLRAAARTPASRAQRDRPINAASSRSCWPSFQAYGIAVGLEGVGSGW